jgi:3-hydroxyacyl-[acyl-carrier-protein] dehydratase
MPAPPLYDYSKCDFTKPVYTIDDIRRVNPQRGEMEQLSGVVLVDRDKHGIVGYKEVTENEFWTQGHMPGYPIMPGVILCECAAQLAGFYARKFNMLGGDFLGFGGMEDVRFRYPVIPPCRLIVVAQFRSLRGHRRAEFAFQGFVKDRMVLSGTMIGVPFHVGKDAEPAADE